MNDVEQTAMFAPLCDDANVRRLGAASDIQHDVGVTNLAEEEEEETRRKQLK